MERDEEYIPRGEKTKNRPFRAQIIILSGIFVIPLLHKIFNKKRHHMIEGKWKPCRTNSEWFVHQRHKERGERERVFWVGVGEKKLHAFVVSPVE